MLLFNTLGPLDYGDVEALRMRFIDDVFVMGSGYVLDFSNRTFAEFFEDEFGINIYEEKYGERGQSKANHLRCFIETEDGYLVGKVLRRMFEYRTQTLVTTDPSRALAPAAEQRFFQLVDKIETGFTPAVLKSLSGVAGTLDFDTVQRDLNRALASAEVDPEDAATAASSLVESVCRSILVELDMPLPPKKDMDGLIRAVQEPLGLSPGRMDLPAEIKGDIRQILSGLTSVAKGIGALRTHAGDAHGREKGYRRIDPRIARLAINAAASLAMFFIETWERKQKRALPLRSEPA